MPKKICINNEIIDVSEQNVNDKYPGHIESPFEHKIEEELKEQLYSNIDLHDAQEIDETAQFDEDLSINEPINDNIHQKHK